MPTVLRSGPFRFFFYAADGVEPPHVHVQRDRKTAKFWLDSVSLAQNDGFSPTELGRLVRLVDDNRMDILNSWNDFFSS